MHEFEENYQEKNKKKQMNIRRRIEIIYKIIVRKVKTWFRKKESEEESDNDEEITDKNKALLLKNLKVLGSNNNVL